MFRDDHRGIVGTYFNVIVHIQDRWWEPRTKSRRLRCKERRDYNVATVFRHHLLGIHYLNDSVKMMVAQYEL